MRTCDLLLFHWFYAPLQIQWCCICESPTQFVAHDHMKQHVSSNKGMAFKCLCGIQVIVCRSFTHPRGALRILH